MTMVVTKPCIGCKHQDCVSVCPVEAFHEGQNQVVINPESCTECEACVSACPENAIFHEDDVPSQFKMDIGFNESMSQAWPVAE